MISFPAGEETACHSFKLIESLTNRGSVAQEQIHASGVSAYGRS